jgi:hypothetical protein
MSRSNPILSLNPLFYGKHNSNLGKTTLGLYNGGLMADRGHPNHIYKILLLHLCFYLFYPNSLFQPPTLFSPHPSGGLRCSRWPCRPRTTIRQAPPDGVPPGAAIQGDWHEFAHSTDPDSQNATVCGQTARFCSAMLRPPAWLVRPPAPGAEALCHVLGTHGHVRVTTAKLRRQQARLAFSLLPFYL